VTTDSSPGDVATSVVENPTATAGNRPNMKPLTILSERKKSGTTTRYDTK
jgi:hypothetical protein